MDIYKHYNKDLKDNCVHCYCLTIHIVRHSLILLNKVIKVTSDKNLHFQHLLSAISQRQHSLKSVTNIINDLFDGCLLQDINVY